MAHTEQDKVFQERLQPKQTRRPALRSRPARVAHGVVLPTARHRRSARGNVVSRNSARPAQRTRNNNVRRRVARGNARDRRAQAQARPTARPLTVTVGEDRQPAAAPSSSCWQCSRSLACDHLRQKRHPARQHRNRRTLERLLAIVGCGSRTVKQCCQKRPPTLARSRSRPGDCSTGRVNSSDACAASRPDVRRALRPLRPCAPLARDPARARHRRTLSAMACESGPAKKTQKSRFFVPNAPCAGTPRLLASRSTLARPHTRRRSNDGK